MWVTDFLAGEIATELLNMLITITRKVWLCKVSAEQLKISVDEFLPIVDEIKYSGVELNETRKMHLDTLSSALRNGHELSGKALASSNWNVYKNLQLCREMEKVEKNISKFMRETLQSQVLADVHHVRSETALARRLNNMEEEEHYVGSLVTMMMELGKRKVKEMILDRDDLVVIGINGIGGSGKTTLAREICRDGEVRSYFNKRIFFLSVTQSPNLEQLKQRIWGFITETKSNRFLASTSTLQSNNRSTVKPSLVVLDDVWSLPVLRELIFKVPGCKTLVVSRIKFPSSVLNSTYELESLTEEDAISLFCHFAFGTTSIPPGSDEDLIKQVVEKCRGLPLALKVIGASLRDQPEMYWRRAHNKLSRAQSISDTHETELLNRMKLSIDHLSEKMRDFFLDLCCFPKDKKIPLEILINIWTELHYIDEEEAFAIIVDLSNKNLVTLVKNARAGDMYGSNYEISVSQYNVFRDLAIYMSSLENINHRSRFVMARRENRVPIEWGRNIDAEIVSVYTGEMREMDWSEMEFPKAKVLILNFDSTEYFLPQFIKNMPELRALVLINYNTKTANIHNLLDLGKSSNLRSLWFEKITIPQLPSTFLPITKLEKISLLGCKINLKNEDLAHLFPHLSRLTMDHCTEMTRLPLTICQVTTLKSLNITNCESLEELPIDIGKLEHLQILRLYGCPKLKMLPSGIKNLVCLEFIDVSECVNLERLNEEIGGCVKLREIDMSVCLRIKTLPRSITLLRSLRRVTCDEVVALQWKELPSLCVRVTDKCYELCGPVDKISYDTADGGHLWKQSLYPWVEHNRLYLPSPCLLTIGFWVLFLSYI